MSTSFPTSLDSLTNPISTDKLNAPAHSTQHANSNDAIEALEAKVGVDSSAVATTLEYILKNTTAGHDHDGSNSKTISASNILAGTLPLARLVNITNTEISASANIAISKTALGTYTAPTSYSSIWTATGVAPSLGNGTIVGYYTQIAKMVNMAQQITFGSTTTFGTGTWLFSLPIASGGTSSNIEVGISYTSLGATYYIGAVAHNNSTTIFIVANASGTPWSVSSPAAWGSGNVIYLSILYQVA